MVMVKEDAWRRSVEALARRLCAEEGHNPDRVATNVLVRMESVVTPGGTVNLETDQKYPLWNFWIKTARTVLEYSSDERRADKNEIARNGE